MANLDYLSATLRQLRKDAGLSGTEAARRAGLTQSRVSRSETGAYMPSTDQVDALCRVYGAPAALRRELVAITKSIKAEITPTRVTLQRGSGRMQRRLGEIEAASARIRSFSPGVIFGILQTPAYIRALYGESRDADDIRDAISARLERQTILDSPVEFTLILTEGALRWNMGGPDVMIEQLARLRDETRRSNLRLGIIPWTTPASVPALHTFDIYDARAVVVGTSSATAIITDSREVSAYEAYFTEFEPLAAYDDQARAVIDRIAADYRSIVKDSR